jgi:hypothetical protein
MGFRLFKLPKIHYRKMLFCKHKGLKQIFNVYLTRNPLQKLEYSRVYRCPHATLNDMFQMITPLATDKANLNYIFEYLNDNSKLIVVSGFPNSNFSLQMLSIFSINQSRPLTKSSSCLTV